MATHLVQAAIDSILDAILRGRFEPGNALPPEKELAAWLDVSRPTMREAVRTLAERGVLHVVHGRGTFVVDPSHWSDIPTIMWWIENTTTPHDLGTYLVELRRMIEVGACGLAAARHSHSDLLAMREALERYDQAVAEDDIDAAAQADLDFHQRILDASGNPFLAAVMAPLATALHSSRKFTTEITDVRQRARLHHLAILERIERRDVVGAKEAMRSHMTQTRDDIERYIPEFWPEDQ